MYLSQLRLLNFRNYTELITTFPPGGAHISGLNASGKSNLLEAIYLLCTGRSQRCASRSEMIRFGSTECFVEGVFIQEDSGRCITAGIGFSRDGKTNLILDGKRIVSLSQWFGIAPVVPCGPDDIELISGPPAQRRRFLDMLISQADPSYLEALVAYENALHNRNRLLALRIRDSQISVYEELMARHGEYLVTRRAEVMELVQNPFSGIYGTISGNRESGAIAYQPSVEPAASGGKSWIELFLECINTTRSKDMDLGFSTRGPHRDEIRVTIEGRPARHYASQGQRRSLMITLRLCSIELLETFRKEQMILLFDDVFSELDSGRTLTIVSLIEEKGQVFTASPLPGTPFGQGRIVMTTHNGSVVAA